jgi:hypothetical protein
LKKQEASMKKLVLGLAAGGAALVASYMPSQAQAADTIVTYSSPAPVVENLRTVCDQFGRCWQERVATRTIVEPAPTLVAPPAMVERRVIEQPATTYIERPATTVIERPAPYYGAPAATYYNTAPGVTVGVDLDEY